jgi:AcrR family transcriptional regulator
LPPVILTLYRLIMSDDLNSVKTGAPKSGAYHLGDLRAALIAAAEEIIRERGVDGFSLREAARRAGVSPAAPQHHFGDARGLLTAIAAAAFRGLSEALAAADAADPGAPEDEETRRERLRRLGEAYVRYALAEPAQFDVMWRKARINLDDPDYREAGLTAFRLLKEAVLGPASETAGEPEDRPDPRTIAAWSFVHGFARLALDGAFGTAEGAAEAATDALLAPALAHLRV